jgi:type I restriction enzyme M protein
MYSTFAGGAAIGIGVLMNSEALKNLEATLWQTADMLRANSDLKSSEYSVPVLGIIFLRFADNKYSHVEQAINSEFAALKGTRRERSIEEISLEMCGFYLPPESRYSYLLNLPEKEDLAAALKKAMQAIERYKPELQDTLPMDEYFRLNRRKYGNDTIIDNTIIVRLLKNFADIPPDASGDMFGQIYEYFLGKFALAEGQGGGEFFTPRSVVRLMVQIIEPHKGTVFDPACGSGGMFVQSAQFIEGRKSPGEDSSLFVYGSEKTLETVKLAKMNIAVNGLRGDIRQANSYYEDVHQSFGRFDYVLANPPFNVDDVNLAKIEGDARFNTYGIPRNKGDSKAKDKGAITVPNANYLWINLFATSLKPKGRAALVMANSASDARNSEAEIRKTLIEHNLIYGMLTLPSNMFYTVTLPATLWFFDKAKSDDKILFIDARNIFTQIDRAHREFSEEQVLDIAIVSRLRRGHRKAFVELIDAYLKSCFSAIAASRPRLAKTTGKISSFLERHGVGQVTNFSPVLKETETLQLAYANYADTIGKADIEAANAAQRALSERMAPLFTKLRELLKETDKAVRHIEKDLNRDKELKTIKAELEQLHAEAKDTEYFFDHINWLEERFPEAKYEDVTGLCKLASLDEVREQEYSLNPGRYVGVVIEEDGKTEEEFITEMLALNAELETLNAEARDLEQVIGKNIRLIAGEE